MTFKLIPVTQDYSFLYDIVQLLICCGGLIFSEDENPVSIFFDGLSSNKIRVIAGIKDNEFVGFVALYNFTKISKDKFFCYMYGGAKRKIARELDLSFDVIFKSLKLQGCVSVRLETRKYNMPMRICARRLGFRKVGILSKASIINGKFTDNILYEKIL